MSAKIKIGYLTTHQIDLTADIYYLHRWVLFQPSQPIFVKLYICVTFYLLITIKICGSKPISENFRSVDKYVPVDMNKYIYESRQSLALHYK